MALRTALAYFLSKEIKELEEEEEKHEVRQIQPKKYCHSCIQEAHFYPYCTLTPLTPLTLTSSLPLHKPFPYCTLTPLTPLTLTSSLSLPTPLFW